MQAWLRISLLLCTFGFFREMRPSEPFVVEYLTGPDRNVTNEELYRQVYPFGTYSHLIQLVIIFLITDILRYKLIIIVSALSGITLFGILLWTYTLWELLIAQIFYGTFMASEVAYYTYIYAKVDKSHYQVVSGHTRAAILCGKFLGGVLAQVLVSTDTLNLRHLHYMSFGSQIVSLAIAVVLPKVSQSIYFYNAEEIKASPEHIEDGRVNQPIEENAFGGHKENGSTQNNNVIKPKFSWSNAYRLIVKHIVSAYTNPTVLKWSIWWSLATCGQLQVLAYAQVLWKDIDDNNESLYNGAVEATVTILGAGAAMAAGLMESVRRQHLHIWILSICSILMGTFLIISAVTNLLWIAYIMYILFGVIYFFVITIASGQVAHNLSDDSFGLIFGINTLVALILQTILTLVVVTDAGYALLPRDQYKVYGGYFVVLAVIFVVAFFHGKLIKCCKRSKVKSVE